MFWKDRSFQPPKTVAIADQMHLIDVGPTHSPIAGVRVIKDEQNFKSLQCVARLIEPYTQLLTVDQVMQRVIAPLDTHFRSAAAIGVGEHLQILRHLRPGRTDEIDLLDAAVAPTTAMGRRSTATYLEWARNYQASGKVPGIDTWVFLTLNLAKVRVTKTELMSATHILIERFQRMAEAFQLGGYDFFILKDEIAAIEPDWQYLNPKRSLLHRPPKPHHQLLAGNLRESELERNPHLSVESLRQQLAVTPYEYKSSYAFAGDGTYQRLLTLQALPDDAKKGLEPLYRAQSELADEGVGVWLSQHWRMVGKRQIARELEGRARKAEDMFNSLGDRVANSQLPATIANIDKMRERAVAANEIVEYALTMRVDAASLTALDRATNRMITAINELPGAQVIEEYMKYRVRKTWHQCAPGNPVSQVDYKHRGKILCADQASLLLPRYGQPKSDPSKPGMPYSIFWTPDGMSVRIAPWGVAASSVWAIYGPPGSGKGAFSKAETEQFMGFSNTRIWYIDNNDERTSVDFQVKAHGGLNVRLTDTSDVCLSTFAIAGQTPSAEEYHLITEGVWFDIHRENDIPLHGQSETILDEVLRKLYDTCQKPGYDDLVDLLTTWKPDIHTPLRQEWATSLQMFCSAEYLSFLRGCPQHPGKYYQMFGHPDGLGLHDLLQYPIVSFNLAGISSDFVKQRLCMILKKMIMSFGILLSDEAIKTGSTYYFDVKIDEGWSLFRLKGGPELLDELVRKHRHVCIRLQFITQLLKELCSSMGQVVLNAANHFVVLGSGDHPEEETRILGLSPVEQSAILKLCMVPGYTGQFFFRRKEASGKLTTMVLENPIPYTKKGSWMPLLTGDGPEGNLRLRVLSLLGAPSIARATTEQCIEAASILSEVWPHGLPKSSSDTTKLSEIQGWSRVLERVAQFHQNQAIRQSIEETPLCAAQ
jgi:hypothetical protein